MINHPKYYHVIYYRVLALLLVIVVYGCSSPSSPSSPQKVNTPSEINFSPLDGRVGEDFVGVLTVSDPDGLSAIQVVGEDSSWTYNPTGTSFTINILKDFETEGQRSLLIKATDFEDDVSEKAFVLTIAPRAYVNTPPKLQVELVSNLIDQVSFTIKASDNQLLDRIEVDYGNELETIFVNRADIDTIITRNYGNQGGSFSFSARAVDNENASTQDFKDFELLGRRNLLIDWETYLNQTPVNGGELRLKHKSYSFRYSSCK
jgi:hypothetical protein